MSVAAAPARVPAPRPRRAEPSPRPSAKVAPRRRVAGGAVWIALVAVCLAGVVALNVAVLRLNVELDKLGQERDGLRARNAELHSQLAARAASGRIQALARKQLGLLPAEPDAVTYVELPRPAR